ncbi:exodeoxyribonuclease VII large subunit [soil metagenome]
MSPPAPRCNRSATLARVDDRDRKNLTFDFGEFPAPPSRPPEAKKPEVVTPASRASTMRPERPEPTIMSVGDLARALGGSLNRAFPMSVFVEGEVVGARPASSGHMYFAIKDETEDASMDVVAYRTSLTPRGRAAVKDGARVRVRGKPTFWAPRGRLQFVADRIEAVGQGAILEAIEILKEKLTKEGLFAPERKRKLPLDPRVIGVVTSAGGAVIHDVVKVAKRRGGARILLAPAQVQGQGAAQSVLRALRALARVDEVDVIIVGRGGGSFDELLTFSDEALVRGIAACRVPVISAVGHEVDVTLSDFAADARAATPSQAAEMCVPDRAAKRRELVHLHERLVRATRSHLREGRAELDRAMRLLGDPRLVLAAWQQRVDDHQTRLEALVENVISTRRGEIATLRHRLVAQSPAVVLERERAQATRLDARLNVVFDRRITRDRSRLRGYAERLDAMSPLKVLSRGYAIATKNGRAVRSANEVHPGDAIDVRVHEGSFRARVEPTPSEPEER